MEVIRTMQHAISDPIPLAKHTLHPGQQHAAEQELFTQDGVEDSIDEKQPQESPSANQLSQGKTALVFTYTNAPTPATIDPRVTDSAQRMNMGAPSAQMVALSSSLVRVLRL